MATADDADKPSVSDVEESRTRLCEEFAAIAGADIAVAQCYLAENEWEMEVEQLQLTGPRELHRTLTHLLSYNFQRALNSFFEADLENVFDVESSPKRDVNPQTKRLKTEENPPEVW